MAFLNDVYFCAQHIDRLLAYPDVSLACGLDYYQVTAAKRAPAFWQQGLVRLKVICSLLQLLSMTMHQDALGSA